MGHQLDHGRQAVSRDVEVPPGAARLVRGIAGARGVGDAVDLLRALADGSFHATVALRPLKYATVSRSPSSSDTRGSHPRILRAFAMLGRLCFGSSSGRGWNTICDFDPVIARMCSANCRIVISC